jgi:hypothetical protein
MQLYELLHSCGTLIVIVCVGFVGDVLFGWLLLICCERKILVTSWCQVAGVDLLWEKSTHGWCFFARKM